MILIQIRSQLAATVLACALGLMPLAAVAQGADNPNLALHKSYAVSDPNGHNFGVGGLTDGSWTVDPVHLFATGDTDSFPKTATIDLQQTVKVGAVVIGVPPVGSTKTIQVSLSMDGSSFTQVGAFTFDQGKEERHIYAFAPTTARYVRLTYVDYYSTTIQYAPQFAFTEECEVYGKDPGAGYLATLPVATAAAQQSAPPPASLETPPNPKDIAFGKKYDVSDPNIYSYGIGGLTDGSWAANAQHCFATGDKDAFPKTATIDLGQATAVSAVVLGVPPFGSTKTIQVSISTDGVSFVPVGSHVFDQAKEERNTFAFPTTPTRYIRLTYPDHYDTIVGYPPTFSFTEECEAYAKASDAPQ
jgi:hypothetical protein